MDAVTTYNIKYLQLCGYGVPCAVGGYLEPVSESQPPQFFLSSTGHANLCLNIFTFS